MAGKKPKTYTKQTFSYLLPGCKLQNLYKVLHSRTNKKVGGGIHYFDELNCAQWTLKTPS